MALLMRNAMKEVRDKVIGGFLRGMKEEGYMQTKIHSIGATLVGVDKFGNQYYEKLEDTQFGRHRWVEYGDKARYNASQVPLEWHGWLHYITDHMGDEVFSSE